MRFVHGSRDQTWQQGVENVGRCKATCGGFAMSKEKKPTGGKAMDAVMPALVQVTKAQLEREERRWKARRAKRKQAKRK